MATLILRVVGWVSNPVITAYAEATRVVCLGSSDQHAVRSMERTALPSFPVGPATHYHASSSIDTGFAIPKHFAHWNSVSLRWIKSLVSIMRGGPW